MTAESPPTTDRSTWPKAVPLLILAGLLSGQVRAGRFQPEPWPTPTPIPPETEDAFRSGMTYP